MSDDERVRLAAAVHLEVVAVGRADDAVRRVVPVEEAERERGRNGDRRDDGDNSEGSCETART